MNYELTKDFSKHINILESCCDNLINEQIFYKKIPGN